ncbi:transport-associated protein [Burkholderia sp. BT03]|nr:transport-associated protein [Burkholderia sp. BT03]
MTEVEHVYAHHELSKIKHLTGIDIVVHADAGAITLAGVLPNRIQLARSARVANGVPDVTSVRNDLIQNKGR